jgi:hypothetical protein
MEQHKARAVSRLNKHDARICMQHGVKLKTDQHIMVEQHNGPWMEQHQA